MFCGVLFCERFFSAGTVLLHVDGNPRNFFMLYNSTFNCLDWITL